MLAQMDTGRSIPSSPLARSANFSYLRYVSFAALTEAKDRGYALDQINIWDYCSIGRAWATWVNEKQQDVDLRFYMNGGALYAAYQASDVDVSPALTDEDEVYLNWIHPNPSLLDGPF